MFGFSVSFSLWSLTSWGGGAVPFHWALVNQPIRVFTGEAAGSPGAEAPQLLPRDFQGHGTWPCPRAWGAQLTLGSPLGTLVSAQANPLSWGSWSRARPPSWDCSFRKQPPPPGSASWAAQMLELPRLAEEAGVLGWPVPGAQWGSKGETPPISTGSGTCLPALPEFPQSQISPLRSVLGVLLR